MTKQPLPSIDVGPEIRRAVRNQLPAEAFKADPKKLWHIAAHFAVVVAALAVYRRVDSLWGPVVAIVAGHSFGCLSFLAHELSHNGIVRRRRVKAALERVVWSSLLTPATGWIHHHNRSHHRTTNTPVDSFRYFSESEATLSRRIFHSLFFPNRSLPWNPLPFLAAIVVNAVQWITAFVPRRWTLALVADVPRFTARERICVALELGLALAMQVGLFYLVGGDWSHYLWAGPAAYVVASGLATLYVWTQHSLRPLTLVHDPIANSTSVAVPRLLDWLHVNQSYHTEHHLFDSMNSDYYPMLSRILAEQYPDRYQRLRLGDAWRRIQKNSVFKPDPEASGQCTESTAQPSHVEPSENIVSIG